MNEALRKAVDSARKEELREILWEIIPPIVKQSFNESREDKFLMLKEVAKLWGVTPKTARKKLDKMIAEGKVKPNDFGPVRYKLSQVQ